MVKSLKGQFILSCFTSSMFTIYIFMLFNTPIQIDNVQVNIWIFAALAAVFNLGVQSQRYFQSKKTAR
ncbi:hypothetical protein PB01_10905 [Psychrobacillus glaciei]|uniref:Uncharacterized protein n=1 Tax=Psychrobacillus glaciei TaxID=2283160 RepID=A0A5J6SP79_9BACI|nr:hypothetical protein [Psychrobacillus glaciei]QFF99293.1 hypothetical protein PB01_10905 [Psychrobacillus glaciei]